MTKKSIQISDIKRRVEHDLVAMGIAIAAILMFVGTGSSVLPKIVRSWLNEGSAPDMLLVNALLLNIALIIFGMRRYRELLSEIFERRQAEAHAKMLSETDPLTGCLNRRSIGPATDTLIKKSDAADLAVAFIMIDLDNFKQVNDLHGHAIGDQVLIRSAERARDLLPADALLARLGGDEFACVIPFDHQKPEFIEKTAEKLLIAMSRSHDVDGCSVEITMSIGMVAKMASDNDDDADVDAQTLLHRADIAMYHAKKNGKNRHCWFEPSMESELRLRNELEVGIRRGLENGEFVPFYEQQVDLETDELTGFEMLARWQSPELGLVNPSIFIPVAEEIGVISEMSEKLIDQALTDAKGWDPKLTISVNISPIQLRDPWFSQKLLKMLVRHNFPPERLEIEITESCLHENIGVVRSMITSLKNQGVRISLDDFGTGYSSLTQLRSLPFDRLKIDRSFVNELNEANDSENIINAIISLGDSLDMPITAEGIEDTEILKTLRGKGRMKGQGYLYGQPENSTQVQKRLEKLGMLAVATDANETQNSRSSGIEPEHNQTRRKA